MQMIVGGITPQCKLSLRGVVRVLDAMHHGLGVGDVLVNMCYVTHPAFIPIAREHWLAAVRESQKEVCNNKAQKKIPRIWSKIVSKMC